MKLHPETQTVRIQEGIHCRDCGWPIIHVCCNWDDTDFPEYEYCDWWGYCSNKCCKNHKGEDWYNDLSFAEKD